MGFLEPTHLILIALVVLILFGPKKIPELMRGLGKGMGELQKGIADGKAALNSAMHEIQHEPVVEHSTTPAAESMAKVEAPSEPPLGSVSKEEHVPNTDSAKTA